jgi:MtN3 and saliva related transmembrane protein
MAVETVPPPRVPTWFQRYMYVVGIGGNLLFYWQAFEIYSSGQARDVSLPAFLIGLWAVSSWFAYGLWLKDRVIISANVVAIIGAGLVVVGKLLYGM